VALVLCRGSHSGNSGTLRYFPAHVKLHPTSAAGRNVFTGYGAGYVLVNGERFERSIIVLPDRLIDWEPQAFALLDASHFEALVPLELEMLLLGTGGALRFPHPRLTAALTRARAGVEVMDVHAACRTYNILAAEERRVGAALLFS